MRIVPVNEYRVEVTLSPEELDGYDITYEQLDYADPDTRRVLWTLLSEIRRSSGVDLDLSGKLLIEATRETDGCCRVSFTSLPPKDGRNGSVKQLVKAETPPVVLECAGLDDAVLAAAACRAEAPTALYTLNGRYRLVFRVPSGERSAVALRVCEFGELPPHPARLAAECGEYWQCVLADGAAETLRRLA